MKNALTLVQQQDADLRRSTSIVRFRRKQLKIIAVGRAVQCRPGETIPAPGRSTMSMAEEDVADIGGLSQHIDKCIRLFDHRMVDEEAGLERRVMHKNISRLFTGGSQLPLQPGKLSSAIVARLRSRPMGVQKQKQPVISVQSALQKAILIARQVRLDSQKDVAIIMIADQVADRHF